MDKKGKAAAYMREYYAAHPEYRKKKVDGQREYMNKENIRNDPKISMSSSTSYSLPVTL
jgi:hypothetical protein